MGDSVRGYRNVDCHEGYLGGNCHEGYRGGHPATGVGCRVLSPRRVADERLLGGRYSFAR